MPRSKPISQDLRTDLLPGVKFLAGLTEGHGYTRAHLGGVRTPPSVVGAPVWSTGRYGSQLGGFTTSNYYLWNNVSIVNTYPCWVACLFFNTDTTSDSWLFTQGNTTQYWGIRLNTGGVANKITYQASSGNPSYTTTQASDGRPHLVVGVTLASNLHKLYWDGRLVNTSFNATSAFSVPGNVALGVLYRTSASSAAIGSTIISAAMGSGNVPQPWALYQDWITGNFAAFRRPDETAHFGFSAAAPSLLLAYDREARPRRASRSRTPMPGALIRNLAARAYLARPVPVTPSTRKPIARQIPRRSPPMPSKPTGMLASRGTVRAPLEHGRIVSVYLPRFLGAPGSVVTVDPRVNAFAATSVPADVDPLAATSRIKGQKP